MILAEATRQYQATLTAHQAAYPTANCDEADLMDAELEAARKQMEVAYLQHSIERPANA